MAKETQIVSLNLNRLRTKLGQIAFDNLKQLDLLPISNCLLEADAINNLNLKELDYLGGNIDLLSLKAIVEARFDTPFSPPNPLPLSYIPINEWSARFGRKKTKELLLEKLSEANSIYILFDSWLDRRSLSYLLEFWEEATEGKNLKLIGPNPSEILRLKLSEKKEIGEIATILKTKSVSRMEAGNCKETTVSYLNAGLDTVFTHDFSLKSEFDVSFFEELKSLNSMNKGLANIYWTFTNSNKNYLLSLKGIALARLLLPNNFNIIAPTSLLDVETSNFALQLGANSNGYLAYDKDTAKNLKIPLLSSFYKEDISNLAA